MMRILAGILAAGAFVAQAAFPQAFSEYQLKSAFVYNFATFIDWPADTGKELVLCVAAPQAAVEYFKELDRKPVGSMVLAIRPMLHGASVVPCNILYVANSNEEELDSWLPELKGRKTLTVGESQTSLQNGVMVGVAVEGAKIVFDVNAEAARRAGLHINSKLLRLARSVYGAAGNDESAR